MRAHHTRLVPGPPVIWRSPSMVQIGLDAERGLLLDGLTGADRDLLETLTTGPGRPADADPSELLDLLDEAGLLIHGADASDSAPIGPDAAALTYRTGRDGRRVLARRGGSAVRVVGAGRTGSAIAVTLAAAGVGTVQIIDRSPARAWDTSPAGVRPGESGPTRQDGTRQAVRTFGAASPTPRPGAPLPSCALVVLVEPDAADAVAAKELVGADVTHLSVVIGQGTVVVGPLVVPGHGACLACLDLHRRDRDPDWPRVLLQVLSARRSTAGRPGRAAAEETVLAQLGASVAALQVLAHLDASGEEPRPAATSATLELALPDGLPRRRPWPPHPDCGCCWSPGTAGSDQRTAPARVTMAP